MSDELAQNLMILSSALLAGCWVLDYIMYRQALTEARSLRSIYGIRMAAGADLYSMLDKKRAKRYNARAVAKMKKKGEVY
jgi:hypothetical protein